MKVRPAKFSDSKEIAEIWNPYIKNTFVTFNVPAALDVRKPDAPPPITAKQLAVSPVNVCPDSVAPFVKSMLAEVLLADKVMCVSFANGIWNDVPFARLVNAVLPAATVYVTVSPFANNNALAPNSIVSSAFVTDELALNDIAVGADTVTSGELS